MEPRTSRDICAKGLSESEVTPLRREFYAEYTKVPGLNDVLAANVVRRFHSFPNFFAEFIGSGLLCGDPM